MGSDLSPERKSELLHSLASGEALKAALAEADAKRELANRRVAKREGVNREVANQDVKEMV
jgi:hypothetical protein